jgi:hypothetical protein
MKLKLLILPEGTAFRERCGCPSAMRENVNSSLEIARFEDGRAELRAAKVRVGAEAVKETILEVEVG